MKLVFCMTAFQAFHCVLRSEKRTHYHDAALDIVASCAYRNREQGVPTKHMEDELNTASDLISESTGNRNEAEQTVYIDYHKLSDPTL